MKRTVLLSILFTANCMLSANAQSPAALTDADWAAAAKIALALASRDGTAPVVIDDDLQLEAKNALRSLRQVISLADVPAYDLEATGPDVYVRVLRFQQQGDRIEFFQGSVYPKVYKPGDCRLTMQMFLARGDDGEWKQDGGLKIRVCSSH